MNANYYITSEIVETKYGKLVVDFDLRYHIYTAYLVNCPSVVIQTRFEDLVVKKAETAYESYLRVKNN